MIQGRVEGDPDRPVQIRIQPGKFAMVAGDVAIEGASKADLYDGVDAQTIAGILPALSAWRRMLKDGPKRFGESYYWGTMPLAGQRPLRHCFVGLDGEMEIRWLYHPETMMPECIEVVADRDEDPAEIWIQYDGDDVSNLELRYGITPKLSIEITSWTVEPADRLSDENGGDESEDANRDDSQQEGDQ